MQASLTETMTERDGEISGAVLRSIAGAGLIGFAGMALTGEISDGFGLGLRLVSNINLAAVALVCAALWAGSLWLDAHRAAGRIAQQPKPQYCPHRRALNGTMLAGKHPTGPATLKLIAAPIDETLAAYPGRRGEDKVFFLARAAIWYRAVLIVLATAAVFTIATALAA